MYNFEPYKHSWFCAPGAHLGRVSADVDPAVLQRLLLVVLLLRGGRLPGGEALGGHQVRPIMHLCV